MRVNSSVHVPLESHPSDITVDAEGRALVLMKKGQDGFDLVAYDLEGTVQWTHSWANPSVPYYSAHEIQIDRKGVAWVLYEDAVTGISTASGAVVESHKIPKRAIESAAAFQLLDDGFLISLCRHKTAIGYPRVMRLDRSRSVRWVERIPTSALNPEQLQAWQAGQRSGPGAGTWIPTISPPLVLSGRSVLAGFWNMPRTGTGVWYSLNLESGRLQWTTPEQPIEHAVSLPDGRFLVSGQGYGEFQSVLYSEQGQLLDRWATSGYAVTTTDNEVRLLEMQNVIPSKSAFVALRAGGAVQRGPTQNGYYSSYPAVLGANVVVFWRHGHLFAVDQDMHQHSLMTIGDNAKAFASPLSVAPDGRLVFSVTLMRYQADSIEHEPSLWMVNTDLGPLAHSHSPCERRPAWLAR